MLRKLSLPFDTSVMPVGTLLFVMLNELATLSCRVPEPVTPTPEMKLEPLSATD